jgi:hypothetical protein
MPVLNARALSAPSSSTRPRWRSSRPPTANRASRSRFGCPTDGECRAQREVGPPGAGHDRRARARRCVGHRPGQAGGRCDRRGGHHGAAEGTVEREAGGSARVSAGVRRRFLRPAGPQAAVQPAERVGEKAALDPACLYAARSGAGRLVAGRGERGAATARRGLQARDRAGPAGAAAARRLEA